MQLKEYRKTRNTSEYSMEDRVNAIPCFYNMKREAWNAGN